MTIEAAGSTALGIFVAYTLRYFMRRMKTFTPKGFTTVIGTVAGGGIIKLLAKTPEAIWWYFIGLLAGAVLYTLVAACYGSGGGVSYVDIDDDGGHGGGGSSGGGISGGGGGGSIGGGVFRPPNI